MNEEMLQRLEKLEAVVQIRNAISQYMHLCDDLTHPDTARQIGALFSETAIWEGIGELYQHKLGRHCGRAAIVGMMNAYISEPSHFAINVHYLTAEHIRVDENNRAVGRWKMLQASTFRRGGSHLNSAELVIEFIKQDQQWLIHHFITRNLFSRPVDDWHSLADLPVPDDH
ncbi:nuclear transport factor 2 family protein [Klebsiella aerogenes]|uniref:nuclear transport factor 2 family protein n=1 Tax=Klebsiella aerogenes TaxID=548 RepID=UPI00063C7260|nr:nuclear transport factor 2 family protein [Klebsiella aerogenes]KLF03552.1 polyketide cyclase [Klebsiella aerogenes]MDN3809247.1 nuclear transport factor 2 family protein [Klebsiella aerogenes]RSV93799.1 nuclear transport factor 2 family protein [Klebsiella aerogenes]HDU3770481.1 nuclear transport factor 2 family protein [Klebsiella aerogenes]